MAFELFDRKTAHERALEKRRYGGKREPRLRVARRGTYCEEVVPDSSYFRAHPCERKGPLEKVGGAYYCTVHAKKKKGIK